MPDKLDFAAMERAASGLLGTHDFSAFCANKHMKKSTVRTLMNIEIRHDGHEVQLLFTGDGFLYNMVRILAGTLVEVGLGLRDADSMGKLFGAKTIYIEVFDRIDKHTLTGKLVYPITDRFVVQWEEMKQVYPKAVNLGSIF